MSPIATPSIVMKLEAESPAPEPESRSVVKALDRSVFEDEMVRVYRATVDELYRFVSRRTGASRELAEDVVQECYLRATRAWSREWPRDPGAWLRTVGRNLVTSELRRRRPEALEKLVVEDALDAGEAPDLEAARLLTWGLARLRTEEAELIEAFHLDGRSARDLAAELGLTERSVEGRLYRARQNLRKTLEPRRMNEDDHV